MKIFAFMLFISLCAFDQYLKNGIKTFCKERILYDDERVDVKSICDQITSDDRFLIFVQKSSVHSDTEDQFAQNTDTMFASHCSVGEYICKFGYAISVYTTQKKIRIISGSRSKDLVPRDTCATIQSQVEKLIQSKKFTEGISKSIALIKIFAPFTFFTDPAYPHDDDNNFQYVAIVFRKILWIAVFCVFMGFIFIIIFYLWRRCRRNRDDDAYISKDIHEHLTNLAKLIHEIRSNNSKKSIVVDSCLVCLKKIQIPQISTVELNTVQPNEKFLSSDDDDHISLFACGHRYHRLCFHSGKCLMCDGSEEIKIKPGNVTFNYSGANEVEECHIRNLILNFHLIYNYNKLTHFIRTYPNDFNSYEKDFELDLDAAWRAAV